jgi:hypothetical protein
MGHYCFHAGESSLISNVNNGLNINRAFAGIEHECDDAHGGTVADIQYQACAQIIRLEAARYNLSPIEVYTHANIALPFGRRSDPVRYNLGLLFHYATYPTPFMLAE